MIDWFVLISNAFWILGLAVLLANFSYHSTLLSMAGKTAPVQPGDRPNFIEGLGLGLFCLGLCMTSHTDWLTWMWGAFAGLSLALPMAVWLKKRWRKP